MANEADVKAAILDAASENSVLLVRLSSTSTAPGLLAGHEKHLTHARDALSEQTAVLAKLKEDVDSKFKRHKKFRDSHTRRFIYRATNMLAKFDAKAMKEERDYFDLLNTQSKAETRRSMLQKDYDEAVKANEPLEKAAKEHVETHQKIDELYEKLFAGPTPGFPREDVREIKFNNARGSNEATKEAIREARRARRILGLSQTYVNRARTSLKNADQKAVDSVFFLDEAYSSLRRSNEYIALAIASTSRIEEHLTPPFLEIVAVKVEVDTHLKASKIAVDVSFSREKIISTASTAVSDLETAEKALQTLVALIKQKEESALEDIRGTTRQLEDSRQELEQFRKGIFEKVAGFGEAAPAYNECCDRMEGFCEVPEEPHEDEDEGGDEERHSGDAVPGDAGTSANRSTPPDYETADTADATSQLSVEAAIVRKAD